MASLQVNKANGNVWLYMPKKWVEIHRYKKGQQFNVIYHKNGAITFGKSITPSKIQPFTASLQTNSANGNHWFYISRPWARWNEYKKGQKFKISYIDGGGITLTPTEGTETKAKVKK